MELLLLHSVADARRCVERGLHRGRALVSTHPAVEVFLKEKHGLDCRCLSAFLSVEEVQRLMEEASEAVDRLLEELDAQAAPALNKLLGVEMRYFTPLYGYHGKYHYSNSLFLAEGLKKAVCEHVSDRILACGHPCDAFFQAGSDLRAVLTVILPGLSVECLAREDSAPGLASRLRSLAGKLTAAKLARFLCSLRRKASIFLRYGRLQPGRKTVLVHEDLYDLSFLPEALSDFNVVYYDRQRSVPLGQPRRPADPAPLLASLPREPDRPGSLEDVFRNDVLQDFGRNIADYAETILCLKDIHARHPISLGVWGNPPVNKTKALVFEFLRSQGVKVIGAQHGSVYGETYKPWHFDSDFSRCDHFLSYGFTKDDLQRLYPGRAVAPEIVPVGTTKAARQDPEGETVDILFPIILTMSLFDGWLTNGPPHVWVERQTRLLEYLAGLEGVRVHVKPMPGSSYSNCAILPVLERLPGLRVVPDLYLTEYLERYRVRAVVIEAPSTPLYEVLPLDAEIFLMNDHIQPFEAQALAALRKRVHYSEDTEEIIGMMDSFLRGALEKKRDQSFYEHYVHRPDAKGSIIRFVERLVGQNK